MDDVARPVAEDGVELVFSFRREAPVTALLVADELFVAEVPAPRTLVDVAADRALVPDLRRADFDRRTGQMVNPNMEWYLLAGMSDIPQIDVRLKNMPERGVVGIGEPPTVPTAAAIALAVRNAIGTTVRSLPLTPAKILETLQQKA